MKIRLYTYFLIFQLGFMLSGCSSRTEVVYQSGRVNNINHPEILYWFWTPEMIKNEEYLNTIDFIKDKTPFNFIFLTARDGVNFYDTTTMLPIFTKVLQKAHSNGLKIGLQLWDNDNQMPISDMMSVLVEGEIRLDDKGKGIYIAEAKHVRSNSINRNTSVFVVKSDLYRAYSFIKLSNNLFEKGSLNDITNDCKTDSLSPSKVKIYINKGLPYAGKTVYILTKHTYNWNDIYGGFVNKQFNQVLEAYSKIPFDGTALDEYTHMRIYAPWIMPNEESWNERFYSPAMEKIYQLNYNRNLGKDLFYMRYEDSVDNVDQIRAVNNYMDLMRKGPLLVEQNFYDESKKNLGDSCFIGVHNTFHNNLLQDEIWQTGGNWWSIPRDYGQTDENTSLPTQMGIAACNSKNIIYNMYYNEDVNKIFNKAASDLVFGIRTHYHALNDTHGWGIKLESDEFLNGIFPIEEGARLLNHFNPELPLINTLVIFGMESLQNNILDTIPKNKYKINNSLDPEKFATQLWNEGYRNALISSDVIQKLNVLQDGIVSIHNNKFKSIVLYHPEIVKDDMLKFLNEYIEKGGKPIIIGDIKYLFNGDKIGNTIENINQKSIFINSNRSDEVINYLDKNKEGSKYVSYNRDGSYVQVFPNELKEKKDISFNFKFRNVYYKGVCQGLIAVKANSVGEIEKISAKGLTDMTVDGKVILQFSTPTDLFYTNQPSKKLSIWGAEQAPRINNL